MPSKLPKRVMDLIAQKLGQLFNSVKSKSLVISAQKSDTLPSIYIESARESGGIPDKEVLDALIDTTTNYIDSLKLQSINRAQKDIQQYINSNKVPKPEEINKILTKNWEKVTSRLEQIVSSEGTAYRNIGALEGIIRVNSVHKVEDPVVVFLVSKDRKVCEECLDLHVMPNGDPRAYYLSEIQHGYHKKGESDPSIHGLHVNCRCILVTVLPSFGFKNNKISYIENGYNVVKAQRNL